MVFWQEREGSYTGIIVKPYNFAASTPAVASQVNANFDVIYNAFNGNIDSNNLATNSVVTSKIADNNVTTAKINDAAVTTAKINNLAVTTDKIADSTVTFAKTTGIWWEEIGRTTLGSAGDTISVASLPARKYLRILANITATGGTASVALRFNNDSGSNYAETLYSPNGGADVNSTSQAQIGISGATNFQPYLIDCIATNDATAMKVVTIQRSSSGGSGAGNAPGRLDITGKWANTTDQITRIDFINTSGTGDYAIGSEVVVLGRN